MLAAKALSVNASPGGDTEVQHVTILRGDADRDLLVSNARPSHCDEAVDEIVGLPLESKPTVDAESLPVQLLGSYVAP